MITSNARWKLFSLLAIGLLVFLIIPSAGAYPEPGDGSPPAVSPRTPQGLSPAAREKLGVLLDRGVTIAWHERTGVPDFITADRSRPIPLTLPPRPTEKPQAVALRFLTEYRALFRIADPTTELVVERVEGDALGMHHVRLAQRVGEWPVFGGQLIVHLTPDNQVVAVNGKFAPQAKVPVKPVLTPAQAYERARQDLGRDKFPKDPKGFRKPLGSTTGKVGPELLDSQLLAFNSALVDYGPNTNHLTYRLVIHDPAEPAIWVVFVDAQTGEMLLRYDDLKTDKDREIYDLNGGTTLPGSLCYDESGPVGTPSADCVDAFNFSGDTYDYFYTNFGRDSFDDAGGTMIASVRYDNWSNASWNGIQTRFGPGWAVKDVVAHEWTHGVTDYTADLVYAFQSGALNESFSDVFSVMVDDDDWLQGEDLPNGAIRSLANPAAYGDPGKLSDYLCTTGDNGGVHTNSGISNHAAYLMAEGGTYNGFTIAGIGRPAAGQVYYRALAQYLTSTSNFGDAHSAFLNACYDLYGAGSATCTSVQMALDAVEMNTQVPPCDPDLLVPPDHAASVLDTELAWFGHDPNADQLSYDVFVEAGDPSPDVLACNDITSATCDPGALSANTTYFWQVVANDGAGTISSPVWHFTTADGQVAGFPFYDGFERRPELVEGSGTLGRGWSVTSAQQGRGMVSGYAPYAGKFSVLLDDSLGDGTYSTAALNLAIDLAGQSDVNLDFWWREFGDENHSADGVFISDDDGATWHQVLTFNSGPSSYRHEVIDLDAAAAANGLTLNDHFLIKFQFYDNYPISSDGYAIDEVRVQASGANSPYVPRSPAPANSATNVYPPSLLEWVGGDADGNPVTYDVYLDTVNPPAIMVCSGVTTPVCAPGTLALNTTYYWQVTADDSDGTSTGPVWQFTTVAKATQPFYDGFEPGQPGIGWWTETTNHGRVWVGPAYAYAGDHSAYLDDAAGDGVYSQAALVLLIDLAGQSQVDLDFWWREFADENHTSDGVFISDDDGATWYQILSFNYGPSSYQHEVIDLDAAVAANGLTLNDHFLIKFQFYDNYPIDSDGYAIDEVRLTSPTSPPTSTATATPTGSATFTPTGTATATATSTATPTSTTTPTATGTATPTPTSTATPTPTGTPTSTPTLTPTTTATAVPLAPPAHLAIYYAWPSLVNGAGGDLEAATAAFAPFDLVVLGDGLEHASHGDHTNTAALIANLNALGVKVFGYVDLGVTTQNLDMSTLQTYVDEWAAMGVAGIFFDDAGQDFGVVRARLTAAVDYVHALGLKVFVNAWNPDDVFADDPPGNPTPLGPGDWYLAESHPVSDGQFSDLDFWWSKSQALVTYRAQTGVSIATISTGDDGATGWANSSVFRQALWGAYLFGFDAFGFTNPAYSASGDGADRLQPLPPLTTDPGDEFIDTPTGPSGSPPTYSRSTDNGTILVWGDGSTGGGTFRGGVCDTTGLDDSIWPTCSTTPPPHSDVFGPRQKASEAYRYDWHRGVDIPLPLGSPIYAAADGMVRLSGDDPNYSDPLVQLRHGSGAPYLYSNYMHLSSAAVSPGDLVTVGDLIGYSGISVSGFPHLHLEFRDGCLYQDCNRNPWEYLPYSDQPPALPTLEGATLASPSGVPYVASGVPYVAYGTLLLFEADTSADQLDLDGLDLTWGTDSLQLSFNAINATTPRDWPEALDHPLVPLDGVVEACLLPEDFNAGSAEARFRLAFRGLDAGASTGSAAVRDLNGPGPFVPLSPELASLTLSSPDQHTEALPGSTVIFAHTLQNTGSQPLTLTLSAQSAQNNSLALSHTNLSLGAGEGQVVTLAVNLPPDLQPGIGDCVVLEVDAGTDTSTIAVDSVTVSLEPQTPTPTSTVTATPTATVTNTPTSTWTATVTPTPTMTPTATPTSTFTPMPCYDFLDPSGVGVEDLQAVAGSWGARPGDLNYVSDYDVNGDEVINIVDIALVTAAWGSTCQ